ncbi:MAG: UDP-N-acetylmuramoyl-tripeptide--D-alanyl-D-alanine ligase [Chthonomonas sp.]|nr:UDP-N-acetylmuramoyl-tripeptide--D-alanyl-D-alanine ligase [Chthonomonas sp.]
MRLSELARRTGGSLVGQDQEFTGFALDNREAHPGLVFVAIKGNRVDGHDYADSAAALGAVAALVERPVGGTHILVPNVVEALGKLGRSLREEFSGPVVGITGSNGKTTAKEMVAAALSPLGLVLKNVGNQNSEFTSPLTWFGLTPEHKSAVIEMGMRGLDQIRHLAEISKPNLGLITMIGSAHIEMVGSRQGIADAKAELFESLPSDGVAHLWADDEFAGYLRSKAPCRVRTFGAGPDADMRLVGYKALGVDRCEARLSLGSWNSTIELPTVGRHQALNAAAALLVADSANVPLAQTAEALTQVQLPAMRMEIVRQGGATIMLDTYNASPDSMVAAIRTLSELPCEGRRVAIIGEMKELGSVSELGHRRVGREISISPIDELVLYGEETRFIAEEAKQGGFAASRIKVATRIDEVRAIVASLFDGDLALIKGSRALELERALNQGATK